MSLQLKKRLPTVSEMELIQQFVDEDVMAQSPREAFEFVRVELGKMAKIPWEYVDIDDATGEVLLCDPSQASHECGATSIRSAHR